MIRGHSARLVLMSMLSASANAELLSPVVEMAAGQSRDQQIRQSEVVASIDQALSPATSTWQSNLGLSSRLTRADRLSDDSNLIQAWKQRDQLTRSNLGLLLNQSYRSITAWGVAIYQRRSEIDRGYSYAASLSQWWLGETLRTGYSFRRNSDELASIEFIDVDASRVVTPSEISGRVHTLDIQWIMTAMTIADVSMGVIQRNDRPDAQFANLGIRQYIRPLSGSIHSRVSFFQNIGQIQPVTTVGEVIGRTAEIEWHQRLFADYVGMFGYRSNLETHQPRVDDQASKVLGSDFIQVRLMYRHWQDVWTDPANEFYGFMSWYQNSNQLYASSYGIGARLVQF